MQTHSLSWVGTLGPCTSIPGVSDLLSPFVPLKQFLVSHPEGLVCVVNQILLYRSLGQSPNGKPVLTFNLKAKMLLGNSLLSYISAVLEDKLFFQREKGFVSLKYLSDDFLDSENL